MSKLGVVVALVGGMALAGCGQSDTPPEPSAIPSALVTSAVPAPAAPVPTPAVTSSSMNPLPATTTVAVVPPLPATAVPPTVAATGPDAVCSPVGGLQLVTTGPGGKSAVGCADAQAVLTEYTRAAPGTRTVRDWRCAPLGNAATDVAVTRCTKGQLTLSTYSTSSVTGSTTNQDAAFLAQLRADAVPLAITVAAPAANTITAALGHQVCGNFTANVDYETIASGISAAFRYNPDDARTVITASVLTLCPQFKSRVGG